MSDPRNQKSFTRLQTGFASCPDWALTEGWWYEFRRESPEARRVILNWRSLFGEQSFDDFFQQARMMLMPPAPGHLYPLCPEWPEFQFSSISEPELRRRFKLLFPKQTESLASQLAPVVSAPGELPLDALNFLHETVRWKKEQEEITLRIDWRRRSDKQLLAFFAAFLKKRRPCKARANVSSRSLRADLKALEAYRILKATNGDCLSRPALYKDQAKWILARKRAGRIIQCLDTVWPDTTLCFCPRDDVISRAIQTKKSCSDG